MLVILRLLLGAAFLWAVQQGRRDFDPNAGVGDMTGAFYAGLWVILAIANALVWAPYFGSKLADPLTGVLTRGQFKERKNYVLRLIHWLEKRQFRRSTAAACFFQGILHPERPAAFVLGLKNSKPGSWLEKVYAQEVFRFENAQNCVQAYLSLRRHGIDPGLHRNPDINLVLMSLDRTAKADPEKLLVPTASAPELKRNPRIQLFHQASPAETGAPGQSAPGGPNGANPGLAPGTTEAMADQPGGGSMDEASRDSSRERWRRVWDFLTGRS